MPQKELSIIIPSYQKKEWLQKTINILLNSFPGAEIIVVNDGSQDKTQEIRNIFNGKIIYLENKKNSGKGASLRKGFEQASGQYLIFTDDDLPYGIEGVRDVWQELKNGADIAIGERQEFYSDKFFKKLLRPLLYFFIKILFGLRYFDIQAGLKGFRKEAGKTIFPLTFINQFAIDAEVLFLAKKLGYAAKTVLIKQQNFSPSTFKIKGVVMMFFDIFKIKLHRYDDNKA